MINPSLGFRFGIVHLVSLNFKLTGAAEDVGEAVAGAAEDAGEWIAGAAEDAGDFIMDLFWVGFQNMGRCTGGPSDYCDYRLKEIRRLSWHVLGRSVLEPCCQLQVSPNS